MLKPSRLDLPDDIRFGNSGLSLRHDLLAVGAEKESSKHEGIYHGQDFPISQSHLFSALPDNGGVWLFRRSPWGTWKQEAFLKSRATSEGDWFGFAVEVVDPDTVIVGAPLKEHPAEKIDLGPDFNETVMPNMNYNYGAAYIFSRDESLEWSQEAIVGPPIAVTAGRFGSSVSSTELDPTTTIVAVGMPGEDSPLQGSFSVARYLQDYAPALSPSSGAVVIFRRDREEDNPKWRMEAVLKPFWGEAGDQFGYSVAADGDSIIGAPFEDSTSADSPINDVLVNEPNNLKTDCGAAYVFQRTINETSGEVEWQQRSFFKPRRCVQEFGAFVALNGDTAVVSNGEQSTAEEAWIFVREPSSQQWSSKQHMTPTLTQVAEGEVPVVNFAKQVAMQGDVMLCGSPAERSSRAGILLNESSIYNATNEPSGGVFLFVREAQKDFVETAILKASNADPAIGAHMGITVSYDRGLVAAGAPFDQSDEKGVTHGFPSSSGSSPRIGAVFVFASDLFGGCGEAGEFMEERGGKCVNERWLLFSDEEVGGDEVWRVEANKRGVAVKGSLVLEKGGRIEFVLDGEQLEREEPLIYVRDCALLNGTIQVELTNVELKTQVTLPLIYEEKELTIATVCSFEGAIIEATFSSSKRRQQSIQAFLQRNGKLLEAVLIPDDVPPPDSASASSSSSSSSTETEKEDSEETNVVVPAVVSVLVFLLLVLVAISAAFFFVRRQKQIKGIKAFDDSTLVDETEMEEGAYLRQSKKEHETEEKDDTDEKRDEGEVNEDDAEHEEGDDDEVYSVPTIRREDVEYTKDPVASGAFGVVFKGIWKGKECAVKVCSAIMVDAQMRDEFIREAEMMHQLGGKENYCTTLYGVMKKGNRMCLITEWAEHGSAFDLLINPKTRREDVPWLVVVKIARNAARGLRYLHSLNVVHRDVAARNILVCRNYRAVLGDFGMSRVLEKMYQTTKSNVGAVKWMAPEAFKNHEYSKETDSFSFGVFLWELCTRQQPWQDKDVNYVAHKVLNENERLPIRENEDEVMKDLLIRCWQSDPKLRPSLVEMCDILDEYYQTLKKEALEDTQQNQVVGYMQAS
ncbi:Integrin [Balamuthia mandrillaris]